MNKRDLQAIETRKKIFEAGVELLNEKDFNDIKITEICEKADVSIGTFYYYFQSKLGVLYEIYEKGDDYFENKVKPKLSADNSLENIITFLDSYIKYVEADGVEMVKHLFIPENELFIDMNRGMQKTLKEVILEGQKKNEITVKKSADHIVKFIFVVMRGVVFDWCLYDGEYDLVEYSKEFIKYIIDYLKVNIDV
ncbi:MAG: TetR/AcrR family transcriptional regulator [Halanaerobiales bacterium]|nr:TetR/AcrR family transcriptional regulator [Halanaerobiales bacterium]